MNCDDSWHSRQPLRYQVSPPNTGQRQLFRNLVVHGDARGGKWRGNWRMEWVASTLKPPPSVVYPSLLKPMRTPRLPVVDWTDAPTDLNGLVRFGERRILVSARVPSRSARAIQSYVTSQSSLNLHRLVFQLSLGFLNFRSSFLYNVVEYFKQ